MGLDASSFPSVRFARLASPAGLDPLHGLGVLLEVWEVDALAIFLDLERFFSGEDAHLQVVVVFTDESDVKEAVAGLVTDLQEVRVEEDLHSSQSGVPASLSL